MKLFPFLAVLIFGTAGVVNAQSAGQPEGGIGDRAPVTQSGDSMQQPGTSGRSDYGTSGTGQQDQYGTSRRSSDDQYGDRYGESYQGRDDDRYDYSGTDGTGPKLKGRY
ncbi:MAG: hypothetical protein H0X43_12405 [Nitrosospira sp.]|nr:hypothetical protein [Nitrosospira sp.]